MSVYRAIQKISKKLHTSGRRIKVVIWTVRQQTKNWNSLS